jgi:hypothetical protein
LSQLLYFRCKKVLLELEPGNFVFVEVIHAVLFAGLPLVAGNKNGDDEVVDEESAQKDKRYEEIHELWSVLYNG